MILLAGISSPDECTGDLLNAYAVNVVGTERFVRNVLSRQGRVLFFSSDVVYGESVNLVDENSPTNPLGDYAKMKDRIETTFRGFRHFKVFRLSYVLSSDNSYLAYLRKCAETDQVAEIFDPFYRKVVFLEDVLDAIESVVDRWSAFSGQIFNICGRESISRKDIADFYCTYINTGLRYRLREPDASFWRARPKTINIASLYFKDLIGRHPLGIAEAMIRMAKMEC